MRGTRRLSNEEREVVARAIHDAYVATARANSQTSKTNPSVVSWDELPEALRESNRAQADDIAEKLASIRCRIVPAADANTAFEFEPDELDRLAREEHNRWWRERERNGWKKGPVKNAKRQESPDLVPWEQLANEQRQLDRDAVLAIPRVLGAAHLAVARDASEEA